MITRLEIRNFKSLEQVEVNLGGFNLLIGTNSSGKSNFLDALRVLQGIGNGFTISEILNGKPSIATFERWDGIRGGSEYATFRVAEQLAQAERPISFDVTGRLQMGDQHLFRYRIAFLARSGRIVEESLTADHQSVFTTETFESSSEAVTLAIRYSKGNRGRHPKAQFERSRPALHQFTDLQGARANDRRVATACIAALADVQRLDPAPDVLRKYSNAPKVTRMGEQGDNFAALVSSILAKADDKEAYLEWLKELSPADVDDVLILYGALREPLFAVQENAKTFPAQVLSDGTLRFAAITAAFFQTSMPAVLTLEEIEKGIHPNRLRLLVELLRSQTKRLGNQVIATTHSPDILNWLSPKDLEFTFVATRDASTGTSELRSIGRMESVLEVLKSNASLSELFSEGWLESVA